MPRLRTEGRVVRARATLPGVQRRRARWVVHTDECPYASGCVPLTDLVDCLTERGVLARIRLGLIARCTHCVPTLLDRTDD